MIYLIIILCLCLIGYLIYSHILLAKLIRQLKFINSIQTNLIIELPTKNPFFIALVKRVNQLISDNKITYQYLIQTQKQFDMAINNISHDIRTPLTVASGYSQLLEKKVTDNDLLLVKKISDNLVRVEKQLDSLLTYNRIIEESVNVIYEKFNVSSVLESKLISYYDAFKNKQIELDIDIEKNIYVVSDSNVFERIIDNALGNILTHGHSTGTVCLSHNAQKLELVFSNETNQTITNYDKLFERFYTEDLSRVNKNSGLGLYIIKELTSVLGGDVSLHGHEDYFSLKILIPKKQL